MADAARKLDEPAVPPPIRRFELPDLSRHGAWIMARVLKQFPHLNERTVIGWLKGMLYSPETLFLYQDHSVAMAQVVKLHSLDAAPVVHERFVWCETPDNPEHQQEALLFYRDFARWAKHQGCTAMIVEEASDVPHEMIGKLLEKRMFQRQQTFVRL
jgi:hypothetical protein